MFDRIVVGWDGSPQARDALVLARCLLSEGGELLAVCAYSAGGGAELAGFGEWHRLVGDDARRTVDSARAAAGPGVHLTPVAVCAASPAAALCELAEEHCAEAVVVGSSARGTFGRILAGDVADRLLHGAPCPVAVAPAGFADQPVAPPSRIGVGFDGHEESQRALALAERAAIECDAAVRVVSVLDPETLPRGRASIAFPGYEDAVRDAVAAELDEAVKALDPRVAARGAILSGDPASELVARAGRDIDLLVVGSRGYGPLRRVLLGGVASKLMRISPVPVMVVPRSAEPVAAAAA